MKVFKIFLFTILFQQALIFSAYGNSEPITVNEAIKKGLIQVTVTGTGMHTGQCVNLEIINLKRKELKIKIQAGLQFNPVDTSLQKMLVTQDRVVTLPSRSIRNVKVNAMSMQVKKAVPGTNSPLKIGRGSTGNLLKLVAFLSQKKYQTDAAQHAIWCVTDNLQLSGIYDTANPALAEELRQLVSKLTGRSLPWYYAEYNIVPGNPATYGPQKIFADLKYRLRQDGNTLVGVFHDSGKLVHTILDNRIQKAGTYNIKISINTKELSSGKYFVRVKSSGVLIEEKVMELWHGF